MDITSRNDLFPNIVFLVEGQATMLVFGRNFIIANMNKIVNSVKQILLTILAVLFLAVSANAEDTTYTRILTIAIKNGETVSLGDEIIAELDGGNIAEDEITGKQFWKIAKGDSIAFSFAMPKGVEKIEANIECVSNGSVSGKTYVRWKSMNLEDTDGNTKVLEFDGSGNFIENLFLSDPGPSNTLKFVATEGTVGIQSVKIKCQIPRPSWDFDGLIITQTSPAPDTPFDGLPITIKWTYAGLPDGWLQLKYRTKNSDWQLVPGFEGITFGASGWDSEHSEFEWKNPPQSDNIQFEFVYTKGENPRDKEQAEKERQAKIEAETTADLSKIKWAFLCKAKEMINDKMWKAHAKAHRDTARDVLRRLENIFNDEQANKFRHDANKTVELLNELDVLYCDAVLVVLAKAVTLEDKKEQENILDNTEKFIELREDTYRNARDKYAEKENTKKFLSRFFQKERVEKLRQVRNEITRQVELFQLTVEGKLIVTSGEVYCIAFSPDGKKIAAGVGGGFVYVFDAESGKELKKMRGHTQLIKTVAFSPDGKMIIAGGNECTVLVWDVESGKESHNFSGVSTAAFSPDGRKVIVGEGMHLLVQIWEVEPTRKLHEKRIRGCAVVFSPDGKHVAVGDGAGFVHILDAESGLELKEFGEKGGTSCNSIAFSPDGKKIVTAQVDAQIWDLTSGKELNRLKGHTSAVYSAAFSPDGKKIVTAGSNDKTARIWESESGKELKKLEGHTDTVRSAAFSPDGKKIATGSGDGTIRIWSVE